MSIGSFVAALVLFTRLGAEFVPKLDEGSITSMLYKPVGMSMEESLRTDIEVSKSLLAEFPEITRVFSRIGTSDIATDPMPPNESDLYIFYKPVAGMAEGSRPAPHQSRAQRADRRHAQDGSIRTTTS